MFIFYIIVAIIVLLTTGNPLAAILWPINLILRIMVFLGALITAAVLVK